MKINKLIILFAALLIFASCNRKEYLNVKPKGVIIPSTLEDFRLILDNVVSAVSSGAVTDGFKDKHQRTTLMTDDVKLTPELTLAFFKQEYDVRAYMFEERIYSATEDDLDWNNYYQQIYVSNVVLEGLKDIPGNSEQKNLLEAEAKLHRAYAYLQLVNMYATHYNSATAETDPGVPLRLGIELSAVDLTRASVQEVYDLILEDLDFGTKHLVDKQPFEFQFRPSKAAAYGLIARVYLYQARYDDALEAVEVALSYQSAIRDINSDPASIFAPGLRVFPVHNADPEVVWYKDIGGFLANSPSDELMALYENGDLRREWYVPVRNHLFFGGTIDDLVYAAQLATNHTSSGVRTSELLLIRAECNARLDNLDEANDDLNALREKRFRPADFTAINITDKTALINFVKDERRRELAIDADRIFDLKRYALYDGDDISLTRNYNGQTKTISSDSKNWVLPIGEKYILINPEIKQNPRD